MVLIAENAKERTTESGIILGDRGTGDMAKATVLALGDEVTEVNVGDTTRKDKPVKVFGPLSVNINNPDPGLQFAVNGDVNIGGKRFTY